MFMAFNLLLQQRSPSSFHDSLLNSSTLILMSAAFLGLVHVFAGRLRFLHAVPRSRWLSFAGGTSVAYVFMHLLPELQEFQYTLKTKTGTVLSFLDNPAYLTALAGLVIFYGIERSTKQSRKKTRDATGEDISSREMFWISIAAFASYNAAIVYLLTSEEQRNLSSFFFFTIAIALHFVVNDDALRAHHKHLYARYGRWLLCAASIAGAVTGQLVEIQPAVLAILISFLAGGIILNVLKEELPDERESRFFAFLTGVTVYAGLLMAT